MLEVHIRTAAYYREASPDLFAHHIPVHEVHDNLAWAARQYGVPATFDGHRLAREIEDPDPQHQKPFKREQRAWGTPYNPDENPELVWRV